MRKFKKNLYFVAFAVMLLFVSLGATSFFSINKQNQDTTLSFYTTQSVQSNSGTFQGNNFSFATRNTVGATADYSSETETLKNYLIACDDLLGVENCLADNVDTYTSVYASTSQALTDDDQTTIGSNETYSEKSTNALARYNEIDAQKKQLKTYQNAYDLAGNALLTIGNVEQTNKSEVQSKLSDYLTKKETLVNYLVSINVDNSIANSYINSSYETCYDTKLEQVNSLKIQIDKPIQNTSFDMKFVYDGKKHYLTTKDEQTGKFAISGFNSETMEFDCNEGLQYKDTGKTNAGQYSIRIKPKDGYEWRESGTTDTLQFNYEIVKATYKYAQHFAINDASYTYNGNDFMPPLVLKNSDALRAELVKDGYSIPAKNATDNYIQTLLDGNGVSFDVTKLLIFQGIKITYAYNDVIRNAVSDVGRYIVNVTFADSDDEEENFKNYNEITTLTSNLVINALSVSYVDEQLVEKVALTTMNGAGIVPDASLEVKEMSVEDFPLDSNSTKFRKYIAENEEIVYSYDIKITGSENILHGGQSQLRILIPENVKGKDFKLLHIHGTETYYNVDVVNYTIDGDYVVFNIVNFSTFSFVCQKEVGLAWWAILLICFAGLVVVLAGIYLALFFAWKKNGSTKAKALVPYFEKTYKTIYKIEYNKTQELSSSNVKLLEDVKSDNEFANLEQSSNKNLAKQDKKEDLNIKELKKKTTRPTIKLRKTSQETVSEKKKVGRPKKEKVDSAPKKRGRPRKVVEETAPKKRGRPRKEKVEKPKLKRGRPKKVVDTPVSKKRRGRPRKTDK